MTDTTPEQDLIEGTCPHCGIYIAVMKNEIACGIFRCGILKDGQQMNPHASREECEKTEVQAGCKKPFKFHENRFEACDYI